MHSYRYDILHVHEKKYNNCNEYFDHYFISLFDPFSRIKYNCIKRTLLFTYHVTIKCYPLIPDLGSLLCVMWQTPFFLFNSYYFPLYYLHYSIPTWCHFKQASHYLSSYIDKYLQYMLWILYTCICIFSVTYIPYNIKYSMLVFAQIVHNLFVQKC